MHGREKSDFVAGKPTNKAVPTAAARGAPRHPQAGYRFYADGQPGEWRIDLTMELRPWPRVLMMLQSYTSIVNGSLPFGHISWTKLQPAWFTTSRHKQIGGVNGRGDQRRTRAGSVWYRF
jgi:hypothetical protein